MKLCFSLLLACIRKGYTWPRCQDDIVQPAMMYAMETLPLATRHCKKLDGHVDTQEKTMLEMKKHGDDRMKVESIYM